MAKSAGDSVVAGSVNLDGVLHVKASQTSADSTISRIIALVERALSNRSPLERTVDRVSRVFVPCVVGIAVLTFVVCWLGGFTTPGTALMRAITVLVIACPCALGLATPLAVTAALGPLLEKAFSSATRNSEALGQVNDVIFDKTGTITEGRFELLGCEMVADFCSPGVRTKLNRVGDEGEQIAQTRRELIPQNYEATFSLLASLQQYSEHPLGKALVKFARERNVEFRRRHLRRDP